MALILKAGEPLLFSTALEQHSAFGKDAQRGHLLQKNGLLNPFNKIIVPFSVSFRAA